METIFNGELRSHPRLDPLNDYLFYKIMGEKGSEVQLRNNRNMDKRSLYYWSKEYSSSLKAGQNYNELPSVIAINIVNFDYPQVKELNGVKPFHTCFHLREDQHRDLVLTDALEIHYLNMVQFRRYGRDKTLQDPLCRWLAWFS